MAALPRIDDSQTSIGSSPSNSRSSSNEVGGVDKNNKPPSECIVHDNNILNLNNNVLMTREAPLDLPAAGASEVRREVTMTKGAMKCGGRLSPVDALLEKKHQHQSMLKTISSHPDDRKMLPINSSPSRNNLHKSNSPRTSSKSNSSGSRRGWYFKDNFLLDRML